MKITFSLFFILVIATKLNSKYNVYCAKGYINESNEIKYSPYTFDLSSYDLDSQNNFLINLEHGEPKQNLRKKRNENPLEHLEESNYNTEEHMARDDANDTISHEQPEYETPHPEYETPHPEYETPHPEYETPHPEYETPHPEYETPHPEYETPHPEYETPHPEYEAPHPEYETPHPEYETPHPEYPQQHSSTYEQYATSNINEPSLDTKLEPEPFEAGGPPLHVDNVETEKKYDDNSSYNNIAPGEASYNPENVDSNEFIGAGGHPHFDNPAPAESNYNTENADANEFIGAGGHPHFDNPAPGEANYNTENVDANESHVEGGPPPHADHVDPASKVEEAWEVIAMNESKKEVNEPSYKTAEINQIFIKGIDLCKDIFYFRRTKSTYKNENNANNEITPEEPKNDESYQITVDARDDTEPLPPVSKVYIIDNTLEQYMKDIYSILINIQNTIEKSKTVVE
ncbi:conserved Plasmodium protein, unknown function [Plasmodium vinckei lentum]|uniref:Fam-a protein n=1 Tax=Plasmodium vinckei lentum TaxID=138297 RepID=A0A6V7S2H8_PLAVN|nr:conserved Plasmodium protein, unknown function [Plasmodium vinckei lentum]